MKPLSLRTKYTTALDTPFTIPNNNKQVFLPTFHSRLIYGVYTLQLSLSVGATNTKISLALPLQIGVETIYEPYAGELPSFESILAQDRQKKAGVQQPSRIMQILSWRAQSNILPPGYEAAGLQRRMSASCMCIYTVLHPSTLSFALFRFLYSVGYNVNGPR